MIRTIFLHLFPPPNTHTSSGKRTRKRIGDKFYTWLSLPHPALPSVWRRSTNTSRWDLLSLLRQLSTCLIYAAVIPYWPVVPPCVRLRQHIPRFRPNLVRSPGAHAASGRVWMLQRDLYTLLSCSAGRNVIFGWNLFICPGQKKFILPVVQLSSELNFLILPILKIISNGLC